MEYILILNKLNSNDSIPYYKLPLFSKGCIIGRENLNFSLFKNKLKIKCNWKQYENISKNWWNS